MGGSRATPLRRPVEEGLPGDWPSAIGEGPIGVQVKPFKGIELEGTVRSSNRSTLRLKRGRRVEAGRRWANDFSQPRSDFFLMMHSSSFVNHEHSMGRA